MRIGKWCQILIQPNSQQPFHIQNNKCRVFLVHFCLQTDHNSCKRYCCPHYRSTTRNRTLARQLSHHHRPSVMLRPTTVSPRRPTLQPIQRPAAGQTNTRPRNCSNNNRNRHRIVSQMHSVQQPKLKRGAVNRCRMCGPLAHAAAPATDVAIVHNRNSQRPRRHRVNSKCPVTPDRTPQSASAMN